MDWSKIALSRRLKFLTCLIPGFSALAVIFVAHPGLFQQAQNFPFFGYKTKIAAALVAAFGLGFPIQAVFRELNEMFRDYVLRPFWHKVKERNAQSEPHKKHLASKTTVHPWQEILWQSLVKQIFKLDLEPHGGDKSRKTDDGLWEKIWESLHFFYNDDWESVDYRLTTTLALSFVSSAFVSLVASIWYPTLRVWWLLLPELAWLFLLWKPSKNPLRREDEKWSEKAQTAHLVRIIVTKEAPDLEYR